MNWGDLRAVATSEGLLGRVEIITTNPVVEDTRGRHFVVRDVDTLEPSPNVLIGSQEFSENLASGVFLELPGWPASRGKIVLILSAALEAALREDVGRLRPSAMIEREGWNFFYLHRREIYDFRQQASKTLLAQARRLMSLQRRSMSAPEQHEAKKFLGWALQVATRETKTKQDATVLWVLLLEELDPNLVEPARRLARRETKLEGANFEELLNQEREKLGRSSATANSSGLASRQSVRSLMHAPQETP